MKVVVNGQQNRIATVITPVAREVAANSQYSKIVSVNTQGTTEVVAVGIQGPAGPNSITNLGEIDLTNLADGSVLIYSTMASKWEATNKLEKQELECGQF